MTNSHWTSERVRYFDRLSAHWSTQYRPQGDLVPRIARFASALETLVAPSASILDYGCGTGDIAAALAARGYRVEARDISPGMIAQALVLHGATGVRFSVMDQPSGACQSADEEDHAFDAVICSSVLEYVDHLPDRLRVLAQILKPGGWILATVPDIDHPARRLESVQQTMMRSSLFRSVVRSTRWGADFEMQWLSKNRLPIAEWQALFLAARFGPVWRDCEDHPLTLLIGQNGR